VNDPRFFNAKEIDVLLNLSFASDTTWVIIIGSLNDKIIAMVNDLFKDDPQVKVKGYNNGCDLLVAVAKDLPDLIIIDENLPGIPIREIVGCIRRTEFLKDVKILYNLESHNSIVEQDIEIDDFLDLKELDKINIVQKLSSLVYKSTTHQDTRKKPKLERKWPRINVNIGARIEVLNHQNVFSYDYGSAKIENISREGAYISQIQLKNGSFPSGVFYVRLITDQSPLKDWKADSIVVSADENDSAHLKFVDISKADKKKITDIFE
jgi:hypothetical protein